MAQPVRHLTPPTWRLAVVDPQAAGASEEPMGTKDKFWVLNPEDGSPWLFKFARVVDGVTRNEDWAEWVVHHLAELVGLPTAIVRPAVCAGRRGVVSKSVLADEVERLVHGNELLREANGNYDLGVKRENPGYTIDAVRRSLAHVAAPAGPTQKMSGFDVWAGYLLLDAWVAGRDRHHENWAVIERRELRALSPSFDHGNALGFQVADDEMLRLIGNESALARWAERGRSHHFAEKPMLTSLALDALAASGDTNKSYWLNALGAISELSIREVIEAVPADIMSDASRTFVFSLLMLNRGRLLQDA